MRVETTLTDSGSAAGLSNRAQVQNETDTTLDTGEQGVDPKVIKYLENCGICYKDKIRTGVECNGGGGAGETGQQGFTRQVTFLEPWCVVRAQVTSFTPPPSSSVTSSKPADLHVLLPIKRR